MIVEEVNNENPYEHWKYIECGDKVAVDFGCGRWEHVERRESYWLTTPEYLLEKGASIVYAFDIDQNEIEWYKNNICPTKPQIVPIQKDLSNLEVFKEIYSEYKPKIVKCDIEHNEEFILQLSDEEFSSVEHYAIETHSHDLQNLFLQRFENLGYEINAIIHLVHANPMKVIFATKK